MDKHFGYAYQREVRIAFRSNTHVRGPLAPVFLKIGPITDFAGPGWAFARKIWKFNTKSPPAVSDFCGPLASGGASH